MSTELLPSIGIGGNDVIARKQAFMYFNQAADLRDKTKSYLNSKSCWLAMISIRFINLSYLNKVW